MLALTLAVGILLAPLAAEAQPPGKVPRVAYLSSASADSVKGWLAAFRQGLRELGYTEGKDVVIEQRYAGGRFDRLPELAAELVGLKVDVFVVGGAPAAHAAKNATKTILYHPAMLLEGRLPPGGAGPAAAGAGSGWRGTAAGPPEKGLL